ncbi:MAG: hypothetical protein P4L53_06440 [Candidatus Obscuribacterales bacterium]|nr:hypothetical protein [Candidatus Obscuribacterales bacterium]
MIKSRVFLYSLALFGCVIVAAVGNTASAETPTISATATDATILATKVIVLNDANIAQLHRMLDLTDDLDPQHKSKRSVLFFFGRPADIAICRASLEKLVAERNNELIVVTIDPQEFSLADELQRQWIQGDPRYPAAVFIGNGVLLPIRGTIANENIEELAAKGLHWDWRKNHPNDE